MHTDPDAAIIIRQANEIDSLQAHCDTLQKHIDLVQSQFDTVAAMLEQLMEKYNELRKAMKATRTHDTRS